MSIQTNHSVPLTIHGTGFTTPGTAHVKGSWADLIASTSFEAHTLVVGQELGSTLGSDSSMLMDIGTGATPDILINNVGLGYTGPPRYLTFPVRIPAGTRIQARVQSAKISFDIEIWIALFGSDTWQMPYSAAAITTYGANLATSRGVTVTSGSASEGSWTTIGTASADHGGAVVAIQGAGDTSVSSQHFFYDLGYGASPTVLIEDMLVWGENAGHISGPWPTFLPDVSIPSGQDIKVRGAASGATNLAQDAIVYGITYTETATGTPASVMRHRVIRG